MKKRNILIAILCVTILLLVPLSNISGASVGGLNIKDEVIEETNPVIPDSQLEELLFQTIIDIANNKEIQNIIQNSHLSMMSSSPFFTKRYLNFAYNIGLILSKTFRMPKINPLLKLYQVSNQEMQKEITAVIESNDELNNRIGQLSDLSCDCENVDAIEWPFYIICTIVYVLFFFALMYFALTGDIGPIVYVGIISSTFNCPFP